MKKMQMAEIVNQTKILIPSQKKVFACFTPIFQLYALAKEVLVVEIFLE